MLLQAMPVCQSCRCNSATQSDSQQSDCSFQSVEDMTNNVLWTIRLDWCLASLTESLICCVKYDLDLDATGTGPHSIAILVCHELLLLLLCRRVPSLANPSLSCSYNLTLAGLVISYSWNNLREQGLLLDALVIHPSHVQASNIYPLWIYSLNFIAQFYFSP